MQCLTLFSQKNIIIDVWETLQNAANKATNCLQSLHSSPEGKSIFKVNNKNSGLKVLKVNNKNSGLKVLKVNNKDARITLNDVIPVSLS